MFPFVDMKYARSYINCTFNQQNSKLYTQYFLIKVLEISWTLMEMENILNE